MYATKMEMARKENRYLGFVDTRSIELVILDVDILKYVQYSKDRRAYTKNEKNKKTK